MGVRMEGPFILVGPGEGSSWVLVEQQYGEGSGSRRLYLG